MQLRLLLEWNKVQMSSLMCICTTQVSFCLKYIILHICVEFHWRALTIMQCSIGQCHGTPQHTGENNGRLSQGYICNIGSGYKRAISNCRAKFNTPYVSCVAEVKTMKKSGPCYKCGGPHFPRNCTDRGNSSNKFQTKTPT